MQKHQLLGIMAMIGGTSHSDVAMLQENPLSQHAGAKNSFEGQCSAGKVERLLQDLRGRGIDLEAFEPEQLFEQIRGRTLWYVLPSFVLFFPANILWVRTDRGRWEQSDSIWEWDQLQLKLIKKWPG